MYMGNKQQLKPNKIVGSNTYYHNHACLAARGIQISPRHSLLPLAIS
jgi:hypothetical protein